MLTFPYDPESGSGIGTVTEAGAARTLIASDARKMIKCTSDDPVTITVNSGVFAVGDEIYFEQHGAGQITFDGTATLETSDDYNPASASQHAIIGIRFDSDSLANCFGDRELI